MPVLEENWWAVQVFLVCLPSHAGMTGALVGIAASEIRSAVALLHVPRRDWPEVTHKAHYMGQLLTRAQAGT